MKRIFILLLLPFCLSSCEDDLDVFSEKRCGPVVYGLLNIKDTIHYVKLFETKENSNPNQLYFANPDDYNVKIIEFIEGEVTDTSILTGSIYEANPEGLTDSETIFAYDKNLTIDAEYKLEITNNKTHLVTSSTIKPTGKRDIEHTVYNQYRVINYKRFNDFEDFDFDVNPRDYKLNYLNRIYYLDLLPEGNKIRYIEFINPEDKHWQDADTSFGNIHEVYFAILADKVPQIEGIERQIVGMDRYYEIPDERLAHYCDQYFLSSIKFQEIDNEINNGYGIFASKYYWCLYAMNFDQIALDSLAYSERTRHLGFTNTPWEPWNK